MVKWTHVYKSPKKGDVLLVPATVKFDVTPDDEGVHVVLSGYAGARLDLVEVVALQSRAWEPGDKVVAVADAHHGVIIGTVLSVSGNFVWVEWPDADPSTCNSIELSAAPKQEADREQC